MFRTPDPELLSAYLDGELSPQERLRVEEWLARDPAAKQLLEELRKEQALIRALPRASVPRDLSGSVLETAERRIILEGAAARMAVARPGDGPEPSRLRALLRRLLRPRNLGWAILAGSIGLAIMLLYPERRPQEVGLVGPVPKEPLAAPLQGQAKLKEVPSIGPRQEGGEASGFSAELRKEGRALPPQTEEDRAVVARRAERIPPAPVGPGLMATPAGPEPSPSVVTSPPVMSEDRQEAAPALVIEALRSMAPPGAPSPGQAGQQASPRAEEVLEIRGEVAPGTPLQPLVQRVLARWQAVPDNALVASPWEFAGHVEKGRPGASGEELGSPPPGVRLEFTRDEREERVVVEFSATEPQLRAILAELEADPKRVKSITLPARLGVLRRGLAAEIAAQSRRAGSGAKTGGPAVGGMAPSPGQVEAGPSAPAAAAAERATTDRQKAATGVDGEGARAALAEAAPGGRPAKETPPVHPPAGPPERHRIRLILAKPVGEQSSNSARGAEAAKDPAAPAAQTPPRQAPQGENPP